MVDIFNTNGQKVVNLINQVLEAGQQFVYWNGLNYNGYLVSSGTYLVRINNNGIIRTKRLFLLK